MIKMKTTHIDTIKIVLTLTYSKYKKCLSIMLICIKQHLATVEARSLWKLSNTEAELKKMFLIKNRVIVGTSNDLPLAVGVKAYLIYFFFSREFEAVLAWITKNQFSRPDFVDCEIVIWGLTSLSNFYKRVHLLPWNRLWQLCQLKIIISSLPMLDGTFLYEINSGDIDISKLALQLKLLPS